MRTKNDLLQATYQEIQSIHSLVEYFMNVGFIL